MPAGREAGLSFVLCFESVVGEIGTGWKCVGESGLWREIEHVVVTVRIRPLGGDK